MGNLIHLQTLSKFVVGFDNGCKIEELGPLKNLKGKLTLSNLRKMQNKDEAITAKLVEKKNLHHLTFHWSFLLYKEGKYDEYDNVQVLEGLQPHKNLRSLEINEFQGKVLPNSIFVENLVEISLVRCRICEMLPMLGQLLNLKKLNIRHMDSVRSIGNEFYGVDSNHIYSFAFPHLEQLRICGMKKLEQWDEATVILASNLFRCVKRVSIESCGQLAKLLNGLEGCQCIEYLFIRGCDRNLMLNVQNMHNLYHLDICGLKTLPEGLGELTHLKQLMIKGCMQNYEFSSFIPLSSQLVELSLTDDGSGEDNATTQLPQQLQHLTNLKKLRIGGCMQNFEFSFLMHLSSQLVELDLTDKYGSSTDNATTQLPQQLQLLTNLKDLRIAHFDGIEALPEWLGHLTSLTKLTCFKCKNLKELPSREALLRLTKLTDLSVDRCPKLHLSREDQERLSDLPIAFHVWVHEE